jgi:hypothetical protein
MAVGNYKNAAGAWLPYAVRWHNGSLRLLSMPSIKGQRDPFLQGDSCPSPTLCVAVGGVGAKVSHAFAEVWSHGKWHVSTVRKTASSFSGVSCPGIGKCFAGGWTGGNPLIEKWNGRTWVTQRVSNTSINPYAVLQHVSCVSATNCQAVGYSYRLSAPTGDLPLAEAWDGHQWIQQTTPVP